MTETQIKRLLKTLEINASVQNMISDYEAAKLLGIKVKTLYNRVSSGSYAELYSISPFNGKRFWHKDRLMGL